MNPWSPDVVGFLIIVDESEKNEGSQDICVPCDGGWIRLRTKPILRKNEDTEED